MPSFISAVKRITQRPSKTSTSTKVAQINKDIRLDYYITSARFLKAVGETMPFPCLKGASDIVLQVLEPLKLARTNRQDFDSLAQDIMDTLLPIHDQAAQLNLEGSSDTKLIESKCAKFTTILRDILADFEAVKSEAVRHSTTAWMTTTMQHLIQSYQARLQKEVQTFTLSSLTDIQSSVQVMATKLDTVLTPPLSKNVCPELENYHALRAGDLHVVAIRNHENDSEFHVLCNGEKTWKMFRDSDIEKRWIEEVQFYHTARLQPHVRQLFGFTQSCDFLGLVFHDHLTSLDNFWSKMGPVDRVLSLAQCVTDWNEALTFLSSCPTPRKLVADFTFNWPRFEPEDRFHVLQPSVNRLGALQVVFSSSGEQFPAVRFAFYDPFAQVGYEPQFIQGLRNTFLSYHSQPPQALVTEIHKLVFALSPSYASRSTSKVQAIISLRIDEPGTNLLSIAQLPIPMPSMSVQWKGYCSDIQWNLTQTGMQRVAVPLSSGTSCLELSGDLGSDAWCALACQQIPSVWNRVKGSSEFHKKALRLTVEHPGLIHLLFRMQVLTTHYGYETLYLFLQTELQVLANGIVDLSDIFHFSFDPLGTSKLTQIDLQRSGIVIVDSVYHEEQSRDIEDFMLEAILQLAECSGLSENQHQPTEHFLHWPLPITRRTSSVERVTRTLNSYKVHYSMNHKNFSHSGHDTLCELAGRDECVCLEARLQVFAAGYTRKTFSLDPISRDWKCPCFMQERKRRRSKSVDRADYMSKRTSCWIQLMVVMRMEAPRDLRFWYLYPMKFDSDYLDPRQRHFGALSPWTILVNPSKSERSGRARVRTIPSNSLRISRRS